MQRQPHLTVVKCDFGDLFDAAKVADRYDASRVEVMPTGLRSANGSTLPALGLAGRF